MQSTDGLPEAVQALHELLQPYVKPTSEITEIRQVLASHMNSGLHLAELDLQCLVPQPLSLIGPAFIIDSTPHGIRGIHKEYFRHARANLEARREYDNVGKERHDDRIKDKNSGENTESPLEPFLNLVGQQQKHEVFSVYQRYVDKLGKRPAASTQYCDPKLVLAGVGRLPQVPPEVFQIPGAQRHTEGPDLGLLADALEKSVLCAKLLLKREQKLLLKLRTGNEIVGVNHTSRLQALGTARNELINWIETELSQAGNSTTNSEEVHHASEGLSQGYIESQLLAIHQQYIRYAESRQTLVTAVSKNLTAKANGVVEQDIETETSSATEDFSAPNHASQVHLPYFKDLLVVASQQKALAQQKSHLTISLAKQLKEAAQGLDRLADESHLLRAYPIPAHPISRPDLGIAGTYASDMSIYEKPGFARHGRAWAFSSESAATHTKAEILDKLEVGSNSVDGSRHVVLEIRHLLGDESDGLLTGNSVSESTAESIDIWEKIDGSLGAIKQDSEGDS
jgi:hypothetical protein